MIRDNKSQCEEVTTVDREAELDGMFLGADGEDEDLVAFLMANTPDEEPSTDFTATVMQRIQQYEEVRSLLTLRWRRLLTIIGSISLVLFILVSPFALTMLAFIDVVISSTVAIAGSLVLDMPALQWGFIVAAVLLLGWSGWAIRYMAKHSYS